MGKLEVTVICGKPDCDAGCAADWSSPEAAALIKERIRERFGDKIELRFENKESGAGLFIDGQPRISGSFDIRALLDAVEAELEIRRG